MSLYLSFSQFHTLSFWTASYLCHPPTNFSVWCSVTDPGHGGSFLWGWRILACCTVMNSQVLWRDLPVCAASSKMTHTSSAPWSRYLSLCSWALFCVAQVVSSPGNNVYSSLFRLNQRWKAAWTSCAASMTSLVSPSSCICPPGQRSSLATSQCGTRLRRCWITTLP